MSASMMKAVKVIHFYFTEATSQEAPPKVENCLRCVMSDSIGNNVFLFTPDCKSV